MTDSIFPSCVTASNVCSCYALLASNQWHRSTLQANLRRYLATFFLLLATLCAGTTTAHGEEATRYVVIVTGSEILAGAFPDGHTYFLTRTLHPLGLQCVGSMTVGDGLTDIQRALGYATARAKLVIVTGGLGPTDNDVTCEAVAQFTGIAVEEHPDVLATAARRFHTSVAQLRANVRRQTRVPVGGTYLKNNNGTAVGLVFETDQAVIVALPGPPRELQPMVEQELIPYLSRRFGTRLPGSSLTVRFVGLGQSSIDQRMKQHVRLPEGVAISSQFDGMRVDFTFSLPEENGANRRKLEDLREAILKEFREEVYATDGATSLEDVIIRLLKKQDARLQLAEIASGGSVASAFCGAEDSGQVLAGAYVAPDAETLCRLARCPDDIRATAGAQYVERLAGLLSNATSRQWAVVVGPPILGNDGASHADGVITSPRGKEFLMHLTLRGNDPFSRAQLTTRVLDGLRKRLEIE